MRRSRQLSLRKEALADLTPDDLRGVAAAEVITGTCTWGTICQAIRDSAPWVVVTLLACFADGEG